MENTIETAKNNFLEWWFIFSMTGNIHDARALIESTKEYDLLLEEQVEMEF